MDRVDVLRRTVRVDRQWQQTTARKPGAFTPTKTAAGTWIIPEGEWVCSTSRTSTSSSSALGTAASSSTARGRPVDAARPGHYTQSARKHAGVSGQDTGRKPSTGWWRKV